MTSGANRHRHVVIVGGGVIGLCSAYFLRTTGHEVTLVEKGRTGQGASLGNAGWVTPVLSAPVPAPGIVSYALRSLLNPDSPVHVKPSAAPRMARWLIDFAANCREEPYRHGMEAMARLSERALPAYERMRREGVGLRLMGEGLLFCFTDSEHIQRTLRELEPMTRHGYALPEPLNGGQIRELEPALSERVAGGFIVPQERYVHPATLTSQLDETVRGLGVAVREGARVSAFERAGARVTGVVVDGEVIAADQVLLAAGAWSGGLARQPGVALPIQAGKGYSFSVPMAAMPARPLYLHESRVGASPFGDRLRLAGTMELSGINTHLDRRRIDAIARSCQPYFGEPLGTNRSDEWAGMRPLAPDGLPVIGRLPALTNAFVVTGHSMLGITLGPATGELAADLITTGRLPAGCEAFSPERFGR
jgi:D-amino-acid dehydrogenase